jgi:hypothetical protein
MAQHQRECVAAPCPERPGLEAVWRQALETLVKSEAYGDGRLFASFEDVQSFVRHTLAAAPPASGEER